MDDPYRAGAEAMRAAIMRALNDEACEAEKRLTFFAQERGASLRAAWLVAKRVPIPNPEPTPERSPR